MAKKLKNPKLLVPKQPNSFNNQPNSSNRSNNDSSNNNKSGSVFGTYSNRLQLAKQKKIQKLHDTKNRLMNKKKENKIIKMAPTIRTNKIGNRNKINKFALIQDGQNQIENSAPMNRLTHKGKSLADLKHFNDMHFEKDNEYDDMGEDSADFGQANFHGFDQQGNEQIDNNNQDPSQPQRHKSKNQIYKQIIQKSKKYKHQRQQQYEQNLQKAIQLDEQFEQFVPNLKFRTQQAKIQEKIDNKQKDAQYERLMNQLRDDQRIVANKVVDNNKKGAEKVRKKKNIQLKELMADSQDQDGDGADIRGWVKGLNQDSDQQNSNQQENDEELQQQDEQSEEQGDSDSEDQIDQVALSSEQQQEQDGQNEQEVENYEDDQQQKPAKRRINIQQESSQLQEQQEEQQQEQQEQEQEQQQEQEEEEDQEQIQNRHKSINKTSNVSGKHKQIGKDKNIRNQHTIANIKNNKKEEQNKKNNALKNNMSRNKNMNQKAKAKRK